MELSEETSKVHELVDKKNNIIKWGTVTNAMAYVVMLQISSNKGFNDITVYPSQKADSALSFPYPWKLPIFQTS